MSQFNLGFCCLSLNNRVLTNTSVRTVSVKWCGEEPDWSGWRLTRKQRSRTAWEGDPSRKCGYGSKTRMRWCVGSTLGTASDQQLGYPFNGADLLLQSCCLVRWAVGLFPFVCITLLCRFDSEDTGVCLNTDEKYIRFALCHNKPI